MMNLGTNLWNIMLHQSTLETLGPSGGKGFWENMGPENLWRK